MSTETTCTRTTPQKSPNLSFKWLQRRVGAQIGTCVYFATTNVMYSHDGRRWQQRDFDRISELHCLRAWVGCAGPCPR